MTRIALALTAVFAMNISSGAGLEHVNVHRSGSFELDVPPDVAIHLFTGPGETLWVPGWQPVVLNGNGTEEGTVFLTGQGEESTVWIVVDFNVETYRARYARVAQGSRAGTVNVQLRPNGDGGSTVEVTYNLTALSAAGNENLTRFDAGYDDMLHEWKSLILAADIDFQLLK